MLIEQMTNEQILDKMTDLAPDWMIDFADKADLLYSDAGPAEDFRRRLINRALPKVRLVMQAIYIISKENKL